MAVSLKNGGSASKSILSPWKMKRMCADSGEILETMVSLVNGTSVQDHKTSEQQLTNPGHPPT